MHDPAITSLISRVIEALRRRLSGPLAAADGADAALDEWAAALDGPDDRTNFPAAAALGVRAAQHSGDIEALARLFARLRSGALEAVHDVGLGGDLAVVGLVLARLDALAAAALAAFARERDAEVLSMVAHDVSNPLMSVCLVVGLLEDRLGNEHRRSLDQLQRSTQQLRQLVVDVQDVADHLSEMPPPSLARVELTPLLADVVAGAAADARARGVELVSTPPAGPALVAGDREQLERALAFLVRYLLRITRAGQVVAVRGEADAGEVRLRFHDAGAGLPPAVRAGAFEAAMPTPSPGRKKLNAELFLARVILEAHGGRIWLEPDADDRGVSIALALPLAAP